MQWFWDNYLPNKQQRLKLTVSPLLADSKMLKKMPKTLIITDENDVLRDEGEAYAKRLRDSGVYVEYTRYNGTIHDFMMLNGLSNTEQTKDAIKQAIDFIRVGFWMI
jgi:acetyl esterase